MSAYDYRPFIPHPSTSAIAGPTPRAHTQARMRSPRAQELFANWERLYAEPFRGITVDGHAVPDLYTLRPEGAPSEAIAIAVNALLAQLSVDQKKAGCFPVGSDLWRHWQNTELYVENYGLRLDEVGQPLRDAVMEVLRASLGGKGYELSRNVMRLNRFLGDLVGAPDVLGEWSYTFCLFGEPSPRDPWGWQLFGHHLVLNCFLLGNMTVNILYFAGHLLRKKI